MGAQRRGLLTSLVCNFGQGEGPSCNKHVGRVFKEGNRSGELKISQHGLALEMCFECCVSPDCILLLLVVLLGTSCWSFCPGDSAVLMVLGKTVVTLGPFSLKSKLHLSFTEQHGPLLHREFLKGLSLEQGVGRVKYIILIRPQYTSLSFQEQSATPILWPPPDPALPLFF